MEILSLEDLNLSTNARNFVDDHIKRLNKPLKIVHFPDDYPQYASTFSNPDFYVIGMRTNFLKEDFDATMS